MPLKQLFTLVKEDIRLYTCLSGCIYILKTVLFSASWQLVFIYRLGHFLRSKKKRFFNAFTTPLEWLMVVFYSCDIHFESCIGKRFELPHPLGIVIGPEAVIGDDVLILQNVTIGNRGPRRDVFDFPKIEDGVTIFANSSVIGNVTVGKKAVIGAYSLVRNNVPENSIVAGIPARVIGKKDDSA